MKCAWLGCLLTAGLLLAGPQDSETNVNTRFTVEAVTIAGDGAPGAHQVSTRDSKLSSGLRREIAALVGEKLNPSVLDDLARRLRKELHAHTVEHHVLRGKTPEYVRVVFDVELRPTRFDVSVPKFLYQAKQGWSGAVEGTATIHRNGFTFGLVSDGDELAERYTGINARYENAHLGSDRVRLLFEFDDYHEQWNGASREAALTGLDSDLYRTRQNFQPVVTLVLARPLTVSFGTSFERFQNEGLAAGGSAPPTVQAANAVLASARFQQEIEGAEVRQNVNAAYDLRAGTRMLGSDFAYGRHRFQVRYAVSHGKHELLDDFTAGYITGRAPIYERFVAGNSTTLRGWNKYDLEPLGGNRLVHNSVEYHYGVFQVFYDSGAIWDRGQAVIARNSVGIGLRQGPFSVAVACPLREGRVDPIFMVGMNY
jgi:outer membrane protein assembly factor BamA